MLNTCKNNVKICQKVGNILDHQIYWKELFDPSFFPTNSSAPISNSFDQARPSESRRWCHILSFGLLVCTNRVNL